MGIWSSVDIDIQGVEIDGNDDSTRCRSDEINSDIGVATAYSWCDRIRVGIWDLETWCLGKEVVIDRHNARQLIRALTEAIDYIDASEARDAERKAGQSR